MRAIWRFLLAVFGCSHRDTYRERRALHGVQVLHFVCLECGHAIPTVNRTAKEHRQAVKLGAVRHAKAKRAPADDKVVVMQTRGRQS